MNPQELPPWVDRREFPFEPRWLDTGRGRIHYVDTGEGMPVVMLHGNPVWSFVNRHLLKGLSGEHRCIAVDHLGFGLSDKPYDVDYTPALHAANLGRLIEELGLDEFVLVAGDWGGPIGLSYLVDHPGKVSKVVLFNSWCWPIKPLDLYYQGFSRFMGGAIGRYLIARHNFFVEKVLVMAAADRSSLTPEVMEHYRRPFAGERDRKASWSFPKQIVAAKPWIEGIWSRRERFVDLPFLVLWGEKDIAFRRQELERWRATLRNAEIHTFPEAGHHVQEERPEEVLPLIRRFLARPASNAA